MAFGVSIVNPKPVLNHMSTVTGNPIIATLQKFKTNFYACSLKFSLSSDATIDTPLAGLEVNDLGPALSTFDI